MVKLTLPEILYLFGAFHGVFLAVLMKVPTLVVLPTFTGKTLAENNYLGPFFHNSWIGAQPSNPLIHLVAVTESNAFIMDDQMVKLSALVTGFLENGSKSIGPVK
jgi:hypothetical protein